MNRSALKLAPLAAALALAACAKGPENLAADMRDAIAKKDVDALLGMADMTQTPAMAQFGLVGLPDDCAEPVVCTVTLKPIDEKWAKEHEAHLAQQGAEDRTKPEGVLFIEGKADPAKSEPGSSHSLTIQVPYAKVDGKYKILFGRYTAAKLAELKATTPEAATDKTLALGIGKPGESERNMDWKTTATPLPAGGGDPGAAYLAYVGGIGAAVKAKDVDALAAATGEWGRLVLGPKDWNGKDVPMDKRQRKMRAQAARMTVSAQVLGGYQLGEQAVLTIEGTNGMGNTVRGAVVMEVKDGKWEHAGEDLIEIPAGT